MNEAASHGVLLEVAYDGSAFHGWASQRGVRTVEETLLGAVVAMDPRVHAVRGASRTDAGVHAEGQLAAFDTTREIPARGWVLGLNQHLPEDVAVRGARPVGPGYAPRFAARGKRYRYRVLVDPVRDPAHRARAPGASRRSTSRRSRARPAPRSARTTSSRSVRLATSAKTRSARSRASTSSARRTPV